MTIKTILVPTDFSEPSVLALASAKELARALKASIHLLHVVQDPLSQAWALESYGSVPADLLPRLEAAAQKDLAKALPESEQATFRAALVTEVGSPFSKIVDYAKTHHVDLIVMGTHGRGVIAHALLGSVAERVVRLAPCPVMTVRAK
jgi:nucleotide-binding universal stress UspA family protein